MGRCLWLELTFVIAALFVTGCGLDAERGERCGDVGHGTVRCEEGLTCEHVWSRSEWLCVAPGDEGAACETDQACDQPLVCASGYCHHIQEKGERCVGDDHCEGDLLCRRALMLEPNAYDIICIEQGDVGTPCSADKDCKSALICESELCREIKDEHGYCVAERQCKEGLVCTSIPKTPLRQCRSAE